MDEEIISKQQLEETPVENNEEASDAASESDKKVSMTHQHPLPPQS